MKGELFLGKGAFGFILFFFFFFSFSLGPVVSSLVGSISSYLLYFVLQNWNIISLFSWVGSVFPYQSGCVHAKNCCPISMQIRQTQPSKININFHPKRRGKQNSVPQKNICWFWFLKILASPSNKMKKSQRTFLSLFPQKCMKLIGKSQPKFKGQTQVTSNKENNLVSSPKPSHNAETNDCWSLNSHNTLHIYLETKPCEGYTLEAHLSYRSCGEQQPK